MLYRHALTALIDQQYVRTLGYHQQFPIGEPTTRDEIAAGNINVRIAVDVFGEAGLLDAFYERSPVLDFGTFDNCREYGLTVTVGGWTFAAYEHRNSDDVCIEGCPVAEVAPYGPYGGVDKHDVLFAARRGQHYRVAQALAAAAQYVLDHPDADRAAVQASCAQAEVRS